MKAKKTGTIWRLQHYPEPLLIECKLISETENYIRYSLPDQCSVEKANKALCCDVEDLFYTKGEADEALQKVIEEKKKERLKNLRRNIVRLVEDLRAGEAELKKLESQREETDRRP